MRITQEERKILCRLERVCNQLGSPLDGTATSEQKYIDRQRGLMLISNVLYGLLCNDPLNDYQKEDMEKACQSLEALEALVDKEYPDRNGRI